MKLPRIKIGVLLIFALFLNPIIIGGLDTICYLLVYGTAMAYIGVNARYIYNKYLCRINIRFVIPLSWIIIALFLSIMVPLFHGSGDYSYVNVILGMFRKAIILTFLLLIITRHAENESVTECFMYYYSLASILYVLSSIVLTMIPSLRNTWQGVLHLSSRTMNMLSSYGYTNRFGWAGFAGFRNSIDCTISLIFLIYLFSNDRSKYNIKIDGFVLLSFICFLGNMFYGRSGVIASSICLLAGLILYKKVRPRVLITIICIVAMGALVINILRARIPAVNDWYTWIRTPFYNLFTTGSFNNYSANRLSEMIFMPGERTFLLGDGRYTDEVTGYYYMRTDSGFMRQILFWGIGATALTYVCWFHTLLMMRRDWILKVMLLIMSVLFEIKGEVYYELLPFFLIIGMIDYKSAAFEKRNGLISSVWIP